MKASIKIALVIAVSIGLFFTSCLKSEKFPSTPAITFESFEVAGDSAFLTIAFTDGDGDIGLDDDDTLPPYHYDEGNNRNFYNLFLEYFEWESEQWVKKDLTPPFYYRIPVITPTGQNKALDGEIEVLLPFYYNPFLTSGDSVKYEVLLMDRSLKESNVVETHEIIVP